MRSFTPLERTVGAVPGALVRRLSRIDVGRGREDLYAHQLPALLTELAARARVESITASSALEGIVVPSRSRAEQIIAGSATGLRTRSEQELAGYRNALDYVFAEDWRPLNIGLILHLHRLLFAETPGDSGSFKSSDNLVVDRSLDGTRTVRFKPVAAARTENATVALVDGYNTAVRDGTFHPVLLVGLFVLDLLTIHPFDDGNGRVVRVLTNALLADAGYAVGRYVSLEQLVAESADDYYSSLLASTHAWHENEHDPWPWLSYFITMLAAAYDRFEQGTSSARAPGTKQERVRDYVLRHAPEFFRTADIRTAVTGVSDPTIRLVLDALRDEGRIRSSGTGRGSVWQQLDRR